MSGFARFLEIGAFVALAAALHLLFFWRDLSGGEIAGGAGGGATVSMIGANAPMTEMVEAWETAPEAPADIAEMDAPDQPATTEVAVDAMTAPETMEAPDAPPSDHPVVDAPRPQTAPPAVTAKLPPPPEAIAPPATEPLAGLALPQSEAPQTPLAPTAPTAPTQPERMALAQIENAPSPERELKAEAAPDTSPAPRRKPAPPEKPIRRADPEPAQRAPASEAPPSPSEADAPAPQGQTAAGSGGGAQDGATEVSVGASAAERANMARNWGGEIQRAVQRKAKLPRAARRYGTAKIALTVTRTGALVAASTQKSSGSNGLDAAALAAVKAAAPFSRAPEELESPEYTFVLAIVFKR
ncbi:MAG: TonB family protein [Pseudomonadota bacterium]